VTTWRRTEGSPAARGVAMLVGAGLIASVAWLWWPNGEYKPIQPGERGTIQGAVAALDELPSGRPALTPKREQELGGAPTQRSLREDGLVPGEESPSQTTSTPTTTEPGQTATEPGGTTSTPTTTTPAGTTPTTAPTTTEPSTTAETSTTTTPATTTAATTTTPTTTTTP
jgi:hypothetical protein